MTANKIGDAISSLGAEVPEGATLLDMASIITHNMIYSVPESVIIVKTGSAGEAVTSSITLTEESISGSAFELEGNTIKLVHNAIVDISVAIRLTAGPKGKTTTVRLYKNEEMVKSVSITGTDSNGFTGADMSLIYHGEVQKDDRFSLTDSGQSGWCLIREGTMTITGTT